MKRAYSTPAMKVEVFEASESVAACYLINCNVPGNGILWAETNGIPGLQKNGKNRDTKLTKDYLSACHKWHKGVIRSEDPKANGYWEYYTSLFEFDTKTIEVFWWNEDLGSASDYHATRMDGIKEWKTNPNAS